MFHEKQHLRMGDATLVARNVSRETKRRQPVADAFCVRSLSYYNGFFNICAYLRGNCAGVENAFSKTYMSRSIDIPL